MEEENKKETKPKKEETKPEQKQKPKKEKKEKKDQPKKEAKPKNPKASDESSKPILVTGIKLPPTLLKIDETGNIDYSSVQSLYQIESFSEKDKESVKTCGITNFEKIFQPLIERKTLLGTKNLEKLNENKKFFIFYELVFDEHTALSLSDLVILKIIREILTENPDTHLIIQLADDELYCSGKYNFHQVTKLGFEKLENVLKFINNNNILSTSRVHVFSNRNFRLKNNFYESIVSNFKMTVSYDKVKKLFNVSEDDPVSIIDYPCYIGMASNPNLYTEYIPEIQSDYTCLIINSIFNMNRYQLCEDAAKFGKFNDPVLIAIKIVSPLTGTNGYECFTEKDEEHTLLSTDDEKNLRKKIMKHSLSGSRGSGSLEEHKKLGGDVIKDISCQYLAFIEKDYGKYLEYLEKFSKGELSCGEIKEIMFKCINELFKEIREAKGIEKIEEFFINK